MFNLFFYKHADFVDYCEFLSAIWTLILTAPIHCRWSIGEQVLCFKSVPMKKQALLHLGWHEVEYICTKFPFWVDYSFKYSSFQIKALKGKRQISGSLHCCFAEHIHSIRSMNLKENRIRTGLLSCIWLAGYLHSKTLPCTARGAVARPQRFWRQSHEQLLSSLEVQLLLALEQWSGWRETECSGSAAALISQTLPEN